LTEFAEKFSQVRIELKMFNASCNRVVTHAHLLASEEIFGPVLSVMTFRTPEVAFERENKIPKAPLEHRPLAR
jgi:acyl-CoA reductase-like NAD-dependent aldehyde dehydrogenase